MESTNLAVARLDPIGRSALVDRVVAAVRQGGTTCLVGEPGVGKTTVWRSCLDQLNPAFRWTFTCSEAESQLGLVVLSELFAAVPAAVVDQLPPPQRRTIELVLLRADSPEGTADGRLLGVTTSSVLRDLARRGPVLLAIDDLQWCDQTSLAALRFALRRIDPTAVAMIATRRRSNEDYPSSEGDVLVGPLAAADVKHILRDADLDLTQRVATRIAEVSGGNPLYALELARPLPATVDDIRVPPSLRSLLAARFTGLPRACRSALLDVAIRGDTDDTQALAPAFARQLLHSEHGRLRFEHPLLAELLREQANVEQRRAAHQRAAQAATDPVQRARHLAAAAARPTELVAKTIDAAVVVALRRGDAYSARDLADLALALTPLGKRPTHRIAALARCEGALGRHTVARQVAAELLDHATAPRDRYVALMILADNPPASAALGYAEEAASMHGISVDDRLQAVGLHAKVLFLSGHTGAAAAALTSALAEAPDDSPAKLGLAAYRAMMTRLAGSRHDEDTLALAVRADRRGMLTPSGSALEIAGILAMFDDCHDIARRFFVEATGSYADRGYGGSGGVFALMACRVGDLAQARMLAERAVDEHAGPVPVRDAALLAHVCAWQGDVEGVDQVCEAARLSEQDIDVTARASLEYAAGFSALLSGDGRHAWEVLRRVCDTLEAAGFREPSRVPALPAAIEAAVAIGDLSAAEMLCARLEEQAQAVDSRWGRAGALRSRGHIALARGDVAAAVDCLSEAASAYEAISLPLERARAHLAAGSALRIAGRRSLAQQRLLECQRTFQAAGAASLLQATEAELARLGGRSARPRHVLTEAERQVADLAASGLRNAEIALKLHITTKTVETHLGRVYRKLGLRGRTELAIQHFTNVPH